MYSPRATDLQYKAIFIEQQHAHVWLVDLKKKQANHKQMNVLLNIFSQSGLLQRSVHVYSWYAENMYLPSFTSFSRDSKWGCRL